MELRKLASFVDDPKGFRDHFGRLLSILSTDVEDGLLCTLVQFYDLVYHCFTFPDYQLLPTIEEYTHLLGLPFSDRVPFGGVEGILESRVIAEAIHLRKSDIDANLTVKGGIRGLTSKFQLENAFSFDNDNSMVALETILALLIYGLVLFSNIDNFVDVNDMRNFLIRDPVPTLLGDTYLFFHHRNSKGGRTVVCCAPLLYNWFISHLSQFPIFQENKDCLRWSQRLMSLTNDDFTWYSFVYNDVEITDSYGEFSNGMPPNFVPEGYQPEILVAQSVMLIPPPMVHVVPYVEEPVFHTDQSETVDVYERMDEFHDQFQAI
ncbi:uncharacterized protein LOC127137141 [Lathyrus oleraceus]|uniref:uncharacterized protein LOC127137141 n=1 Tax=Pisum sativum TaxID=3888 RepID=UPI0021D11DC3|nr:uncharacterized protein LOC127137141 [Pisum sativum]